MVEFVAQSVGFSVGHSVHQRPEVWGMVVVDGVAKFVKDDVVLQVFWHLHEIEGKTDGVSG